MKVRFIKEKNKDKDVPNFLMGIFIQDNLKMIL